jgi:hypothetical protein
MVVAQREYNVGKGVGNAKILERCPSFLRKLKHLRQLCELTFEQLLFCCYHSVHLINAWLDSFRERKQTLALNFLGETTPFLRAQFLFSFFVLSQSYSNLSNLSFYQGLAWQP